MLLSIFKVEHFFVVPRLATQLVTAWNINRRLSLVHLSTQSMRTSFHTQLVNIIHMRASSFSVHSQLIKAIHACMHSSSFSVLIQLIKAIDVLLDHGAATERIVLVAPIAAEAGLLRVQAAHPDLRITTAAVHETWAGQFDIERLQS